MDAISGLGCSLLHIIIILIEKREQTFSGQGRQTSGVRWEDKFYVRVSDKVPKPANLATFSLLLIVGIYYPSVRFAQLQESDN